jgi:hypothetical protein
MKPKHRNEAECLSEIEKARIAIRYAQIESEALDRKADFIVREVPRLAQRAVQFRAAAKKKRDRACSLEDIRIPRLSKQLAAARTIPLPGLLPQGALASGGGIESSLSA